jgi:hypothetical protein
MTEPDDQPVLQELGAAREESPDGTVDLVRLWHAAGRPWGLSPRTWDARRVRAGDESVIVRGRGGKPDEPTLADPDDAIGHVWAVDSSAVVALSEIISRKIREDPAGMLAWVPNEIGAVLAFGAAMSCTGADTEQVKRELARGWRSGRPGTTRTARRPPSRRRRGRLRA